ncbi:MAG: Enolase [Candidatus Woesearchaeota archaeon]|nr:Enolase [Candidatus Woesearchaeota archaeon]
MNYKISKIKARQVLDSRGNPTVEVDVFTRTWRGRAKVPSGASTGVHEALELRDGGDAFGGKGVSKAVRNINRKIAPKLKGRDVRRQKSIDKLLIELDASSNKSNLGANAILGVSLACSKAGAHASHKRYYKYLARKCKNKRLVLPVPFMNVINGGEHADNDLCIQEFMIVPLMKTYGRSLQAAVETFHILKSIIHKKYGKGATNVGDEGGFAPNLNKVRDALDLLVEAIKEAGYEDKIKIAMDAAASYFYKEGKYLYDKKKITKNRLIKEYEKLMKRYPIISIEDPFQEEDFEAFAELLKVAKKQKVMIVGDDLTVSNVNRISIAVKNKSCNCLLLKVNQVGTLTEAIDAARLAKKNRWKVMVSHRSGETSDDFIADFAVGLGCGMIKAGAPDRGERTSKYNELIRIEEKLGKRAVYGKSILRLK